MTCASLFFIGIGESMFTRFLGITGLSSFIGSFVADADLGCGKLTTIIVVIYLILGLFMEPFGAMLVTLPVLKSEGISLYGCAGLQGRASVHPGGYRRRSADHRVPCDRAQSPASPLLTPREASCTFPSQLNRQGIFQARRTSRLKIKVLFDVVDVVKH
ncbi:hypothetical protein ABID21_003015 [Pseudorhizobium tarimense]|uniref:Uncharacterized protein n=1 Tax=Pseudorhizobium tarimense TaxID=1079109 RepID=A0ABV2H8K7_9HYPH|nr:hypothetical protein [Pseudorhizobium tarimense]MCJ8520018.1 hypothetical protein [Pseudorhizobium tarimense]